MSTKLNTLLRKREQLEQQILEAQRIEKRTVQVRQIVFDAFEKNSKLMLADDQFLREKLESAFSEIAQKLPSA